MIKSCGLDEPAGLARRLRSVFKDRALILLYHRIAERVSDPYALCVSPQHFAEHLDILKRRCRPMGLLDLVQALDERRLPRRAVVVTFDDGYADNLCAKPLLERFDIPATVFVATASLGQADGFWWDELGELLLQPGALPQDLALRIDGKDYQWHVPRYQRRRRPLFYSLGNLLRPLSEKDRRPVLSDLQRWSGVQAEKDSTRALLSTDQLLDLEKEGLVTVGAHTITHPVLALLSETAQETEIQGGKAQLEEWLGHPVASFAYPYGHALDYTGETVALARKSGFRCACSTVADTVRERTDAFQLPRVPVLDWGGERFTWLLRWWGL